MDLTAVRTFVAVADTGQFQQAADTLSISQQAASKRIAALEKYLEVRLFARTPRGAELTLDGRAFLPHAREVLRVAERAETAIRPGRRALRVDVVARRITTAGLLQQFHRAHPGIDLDVVTLDADVEGAIAAIESGTVDVTFHAVPTGLPLSTAIRTTRVIDEPHELLVGPHHPFADASSITPAQLAGHRVWMPGLPTHGEVAAYYAEFAATFACVLDTTAPLFSKETILQDIAESPHLANLIGTGSQYLWPDRYDLRRIPLRDPIPIYPMSLIWHADNPHPALPLLRAHLTAHRDAAPLRDVWVPTWNSPAPAAR